MQTASCVIEGVSGSHEREGGRARALGWRPWSEGSAVGSPPEGGAGAL